MIGIGYCKAQTVERGDSGGMVLDGRVALLGLTIHTRLMTVVWVGSTTYSVGKVVTNGSNTYVCTTGGTSAASGGPTGTGTDISDGSVVWDFVSAASFASNSVILRNGGATGDILHKFRAFCSDDNGGTSLSQNLLQVNLGGAGILFPDGIYFALGTERSSVDYDPFDNMVLFYTGGGPA